MRTRAMVPVPVEALVKNIGRNFSLILLCALFIGGAFCGSGLYRMLSADTSNMLMFLLSGNGAEEPFRFWPDFGAVFLSNFMAVAALFLCGFCAVSQPVILLIPFAKGLGFGLVAAYNTVLLSPYSAFFWLKFMPGAFLSTALILLCAKQSLELSAYVFRAVFGPLPKEKDKRMLPSIYGAKYIFFLILCAVLSMVSAVFDLMYTVVSGG